MGFFNNLANEAGRKTGKALGNMIFGKHANDINIGINHGEGDDPAVQVARERRRAVEEEASARQEEMRLSHKHQIAAQVRSDNERVKREILAIKFDPRDTDRLVGDLTQLAAIRDAHSAHGNSDSDAIIAMSLAKFDAGLSMLQAVEPANPMIAYFTSRKMEWDKAAAAQKNRRRSKRVLIVIGVIAAVIAFFVFSEMLAVGHNRAQSYMIVGCVSFGIILYSFMFRDMFKKDKNDD